MDTQDYLAPDTIGGVDLYAYCLNNPIMGYDPTGHLDWNRFWTGVGIVAIATAVVALTIATAGMGSAVGLAIIGATISASASIFDQMVIENNSFTEVDWIDVGISAAAGAVTAIMPGSGLEANIYKAIVGSLITNGGKTFLKGEEFNIGKVTREAVENLFAMSVADFIGKGVDKLAKKIFPLADMNYSTLQGLLRKQGFNYSKAQVYKIIGKSVLRKKVFTDGMNNLIEFILSLVGELG